MSMSTLPERRLLVAVDMEGYSQQGNLLQDRSQGTLRTVMDATVEELGFDRLNWITQPTGDGELAVLPAGAPEPTVVSRLVPRLDQRLREHNDGLSPEARVRLRVALHQGLVHIHGANGFPGEAVVTVCRLLDARPFKRALAAFVHAGAAAILSEEVFQDVVAQRYDGLRPERFRRVEVNRPDKGFRRHAWIWVPDEDVNQLADLEDPASPDQRKPKGSATQAAVGSYTADVRGMTAKRSPVIFGHRGTVHVYEAGEQQ
jgi:hypothetical protein